MPEESPMEFPFYECAVDSPDVPRSVYAAVGKAAMAWARLEQHLDAVLLQVNKKRFSESLYREHPGTFIGKVRLLKDWFNKHPALKSHKEHMRVLTSSLKQISKEFRNPLLHSIFAAYDPAFKILTFKNMRALGNDDFSFRESTIGMDRLKIAPKVINQANEILSWISRDLFSPDGIARLEKP